MTFMILSSLVIAALIIIPIAVIDMLSRTELDALDEALTGSFAAGRLSAKDAECIMQNRIAEMKTSGNWPPKTNWQMLRRKHD